MDFDSGNWPAFALEVHLLMGSESLSEQLLESVPSSIHSVQQYLPELSLGLKSLSL